jgi:Tfp pilus assembly protein PilX
MGPRHRPRPIAGNERGVALLMVLMILAVLSIMVAAGFVRVLAERRVTDNQRVSTKAYALAETGLQQFALHRSDLGFTTSPPAVTESTRVVLTGGYADVVMQRIKPQVGSTSALYVLRSTGVWTATGYLNAPNARRTVAQYIQWNQSILTPAAAWVSLAGIHKSGGTGSISGFDRCGVAPAVGGVAVPNSPGYTQTFGTLVPTGSPNIVSLGATPAASTALPFDWGGILSGSSIVPDYTIPGSSWSTTWFFGGAYPVIRVDNAGGSAFSLPDGQGLLIVTGDLNIVGSTDWSGLILVGGELTTSGSPSVYGAAYSGLNIALSGNPDSVAAAMGPANVGSTGQLYRYDSCQLANALSRFTGLQLVRNAWTDNWKTW